MNYYRYEGHTLCAWDALPYERIGALPGEGEIIFLFAREMLVGRESFPVTDAALLTEKEGVETLDASARVRPSRRSWRRPSGRDGCEP